MDIPEGWQPYRDKFGNVVTLTWDQIYAVQRAFVIWRNVHYKEKGHYPDMTNSANWQKSCLLARILVDGKPPLPEPPPVIEAAPAYHLVDKDLCPSCGGSRIAPGRIIGTSIDQDQVPSFFKGHFKGKIGITFRCIDKYHYEKDNK